MHAAAPLKHRGERAIDFASRAVEGCFRLTSEAAVSNIRAAVRPGRGGVQAFSLAWSPAGLSGRRILDAGRGTGTMAVAPAACDAEGLVVDISFPRSDWARVTEPASRRHSRAPLAAHPVLAARGVGQTRSFANGFYIPRAMESGGP